MTSVNIPLNSSRNGNIYRDAVDPNIVWYLPSIGIATGAEQAFRFAATQTGPDAAGKPILQGNLTFMLKKTMPNDVAAFKAANPTLEFREIPPHKTSSSPGMQAGLFRRNASFAGFVLGGTNLTDGGNGLLVFNISMKGDQVLAMYDDLKITKDLSYILIYLITVQQPDGPSTINAPGSGLTVTKPLGDAFADERFQVAYTVTVGQTTRLIFHHEDLAVFNASQSEFQELTALEDVNGRYPSISRLFVGRLDRGITVIPSRYVILRERGSCAASCQAVVDSASTTAGSKFQFAFTLVPDVNPIELVQLQAEINARADTSGCTLELPMSFNLATGSTLSTSFASSILFEAGSATPNTVALSVEIDEHPGSEPAVATANAFLTQLRKLREPFLTGSIKIKLDDTLPTRIDVPVLLSFKETQRLSTGDEFSVQVDEANGTVTLISASAFDLFVAQVALLGPQNIIVVNVGQVVHAGQSFSLALPADHASLHAQVDCDLAVGDDALSIPDFFRLLQFNAVDVQETQYLLSVNASAVKFQSRGIDRIEVSIGLQNMPTASIPSLLLLKERTQDSTHVVVPIVQAVTKLEGTLAFGVHFADATRQPALFTLENDFVQHPIFVLIDAEIVS
jgi:hypothetical protein